MPAAVPQAGQTGAEEVLGAFAFSGTTGAAWTSILPDFTAHAGPPKTATRCCRVRAGFSERGGHTPLNPLIPLETIADGENVKS